MAVQGWGSEWGNFPWGGVDGAGIPPGQDAYFMPPVVKHYPPRWHPMGQTGLRLKAWQWAGVDVTISGILYRGGFWNGPLTQVQVDAITLAGYGARIYTVSDIGQLPAGID